MSSLTSMPAHVVLPLAAYDLGTLRKAAERADQRWIHADCSQAVDRKAVLDEIARAADFPAWFGGNLDALNDCLGEINTPTRIIVRYAPKLKESLGDYGSKILDVLEHAAEENPNLQISFRERF